MDLVVTGKLAHLSEERAHVLSLRDAILAAGVVELVVGVDDQTLHAVPADQGLGLVEHGVEARLLGHDEVVVLVEPRLSLSELGLVDPACHEALLHALLHQLGGMP